MKLKYLNEKLDMDPVNNYKPDGDRIYCQINEKSMPDGGINEFVFKMLLDMCMTYKTGVTKYLKQEMDRSDAGTDTGKGMTVIRNLPDSEFVNLLRLNHRLDILSLRDVSKVVGSNLPAFMESVMRPDIEQSMAFRKKGASSAYRLLEDLCYLKRDGDRFLDWQVRISGTLTSMDPKEFCMVVSEFYRRLVLDRDSISDIGINDMQDPVEKMGFEEFLEKFENMLDRFTGMRYDVIKPVAEGDTGAAEVPLLEASTARSGGADAAACENNGKQSDEPDNEERDDNPTTNSEINATNTANIEATRLRFVSASDITGKDSTYGAQYCETFYQQDLDQADSEGFLEQMITSRVNDSAAPIDVLSETVKKEHSKDTMANTLRSAITDMKASIEEAAGKNG